MLASDEGSVLDLQSARPMEKKQIALRNVNKYMNASGYGR